MEKITKRYKVPFPTNEMGVVFIFGACFREFHFSAVKMLNGYPDARAYSRHYSDHIYIEFEYVSSNFIDHKHAIGEVDLIVCWRHDAHWIEKPILELFSGKGYIYTGGESIRIFDWKKEITSVKEHIRNNSTSLRLASL